MVTKKKEIKDSILKVELEVNKEEFDEARVKAYVENANCYPVMGKAPGLAKLSDLEATYGPAVLYDEAIGKLIPASFNEFLKNNKLRIVGRPAAEDIRFEPDGDVTFKIKAYLYPEVQIGAYKGIAVPYDRMTQQMEFEQAVIQKVCESMKGEIPPHMVEMKLDSIVAQAKINVNNDALYHLFADMWEILDESYKAAGAIRPKVQVRREAMDLMLQTASSENEADWQGFFKQQIRSMVERYHDLPEDFDLRVEEIRKKRLAKVAAMKPEELTEELFKAYLGSVELTEEQWRNQSSMQAARDVCLDLLLDEVAVSEKIEITNDEIHKYIEDIAAQCNMEPEEAEANINKVPLIEKLKRDKALMLVLNSAVTDEKAKAKLDKKREEAKKKEMAEAQLR